jgi:hypothetical protein
LVQGKVLIIAIAYELHQGQHVRGATYITVDNPIIIATYLQFILPKYDHCILLKKSHGLLIVDNVPVELLEYFDINRQFCEWYVEVAWQRLSEDMKTEGLRRHWARFSGALDKPRYKSVAVSDDWDDWRGIRQMYLTRPGDVIRELSNLGGYLIRGRFGELGDSLDSLPKRASVLNKKW